MASLTNRNPYRFDDVSPLKRQTRQHELVVFPWWPDRMGWIYPDDVSVAKSLIPSLRVLQRKRTPGEFDTFCYGTKSFRAKSVLLRNVEFEGYAIGDRVDVLSRMGRRWSFIGTICEMHFSPSRREIEYRLRLRDIQLNAPYFAFDFVKVLPPTLPRSEPEIVVQPPEDATDYRIESLPD